MLQVILGFFAQPPKNGIKDVKPVALGPIRTEFAPIAEIDGIRLLAEFIASIEVDVLPCNRRNLLD